MNKKFRSVMSMAATLLAGMLFLTGCDYINATFDRKGYLEKQATSLVTKILARDNINYSCLKVKITNKAGSKNYSAAATLDNGDELDIIIEDRDDSIWIKPDGKSHKTLKFYARELVTQILRKNLGESAAKCTGVEITGEIDGNNYRGEAELDNGNTCNISIENRSDGQIYVQILGF